MANTATPRSARYSGFFKNDVNDRLDLYEDGVKVESFSVSAGSVPATLGVATPVDLDAQSGTLSAANMRSGILVHTSVTGAGTITFDTGANIDAEFPGLAVGDTITVRYINDGTQVVTPTAATGVTVADTGQTIAADEACVFMFRKTGVATYTVYTIGA